MESPLWKPKGFDEIYVVCGWETGCGDHVGACMGWVCMHACLVHMWAWQADIFVLIFNWGCGDNRCEVIASRVLCGVLCRIFDWDLCVGFLCGVFNCV